MTTSKCKSYENDRTKYLGLTNYGQHEVICYDSGKRFLWLFSDYSEALAKYKAIKANNDLTDF